MGWQCSNIDLSRWRSRDSLSIQLRLLEKCYIFYIFCLNSFPPSPYLPPHPPNSMFFFPISKTRKTKQNNENRNKIQKSKQTKTEKRKPIKLKYQKKAKSVHIYHTHTHTLVEYILCWPTISGYGAWPGVWLLYSGTLHWRKLIFVLPQPVFYCMLPPSLWVHLCIIPVVYGTHFLWSHSPSLSLTVFLLPLSITYLWGEGFDEDIHLKSF